MSHARKDQADQARADFLDALRRTFDTPHGRIVLAWLHATAATRKPAFLPGDRDPNAAAFRDGRKSIVWEIEANLEFAASSYGDPDATAKPTTRAGSRARLKGA